MPRPHLVLISLAMSACANADDLAFSQAQASCKVQPFRYERIPNRFGKGLGEVWSPFRLFGLWWLDRRDRDHERSRHFVANVPIAKGGNSDDGAQRRREVNSELNCLQRNLARSGIAISSNNIVLQIE